MTTDHEILGINIDSSIDEIRSAYRKIAGKFHPDKNKDPKASDVFNRATIAYDNLINIKEAIPKNSQKQKNRKGQDIKVSISVSLDEIVSGQKKRIITTRKGKCTKCSGTGSEQKKTKTCPYCNGVGYQGMALIMGQKKPCLLCKGSGVIPLGNQCESCSGTGLANETIQKDIILSPLSDRMTIHGYGNYCIHGEPGNLIIEIYRNKHPHYTVYGLNINGSITISPAQAILGDRININVFGRTEEIVISPCTQNGHLIEKSGSGVRFGDRIGWLKIRIRIAIPTIISIEEEKHYKEILKIEKELTWPKPLSL